MGEGVVIQSWNKNDFETKKRNQQDVGLEINHSIAEIRIGIKAVMTPTLNPSLKFRI